MGYSRGPGGATGSSRRSWTRRCVGRLQVKPLSGRKEHRLRGGVLAHGPVGHALARRAHRAQPARQREHQSLPRGRRRADRHVSVSRVRGARAEGAHPRNKDGAHLEQRMGHPGGAEPHARMRGQGRRPVRQQGLEERRQPRRCPYPHVLPGPEGERPVPAEDARGLRRGRQGPARPARHERHTGDEQRPDALRPVHQLLGRLEGHRRHRRVPRRARGTTATTTRWSQGPSA